MEQKRLYHLIDEPNPFYDRRNPKSVSDTLATWEQFLAEIEALPDDEFLKEGTIKRAREMIEELRRAQASPSS